MTDIISAIIALKADAEVSVNAEDINQITWHDGNPTNITTKQITDKQIHSFFRDLVLKRFTAKLKNYIQMQNLSIFQVILLKILTNTMMY